MDNMVVDTKPMDVPVDYEALGITSGYAPRPPEKLRLFVVGPEGEGKTTFVLSIPNSLTLDFEGGADAIPGGRGARVTIQGYEHYEHILKKLMEDGNGAKKRRFTRVNIDTGDEWTSLIADQLALEHNVEDISEYGSKGKGWNLLKTRCWSHLYGLYMAGYAWTVIGHLTTETITDPCTGQEMTRPKPIIFPSLAAQIVRNSDFYVTIYMLEKTEQETETIVVRGKEIVKPKKNGLKIIRHWILDSRAVPGSGVGKARGVPAMPTKIEIPLIGGWDKFSGEYNKAVEKARKGELE